MSFARLLPTIRLAVFGAATVMSVIVLAMCAHLISFTSEWFGVFLNFSALGLATALLTMFTVPVMIVIDNMRKGAISSMIAVELGWIGFLWVMWLATAALTASTNGTGGNCGQTRSSFATACGEINAVEAFAFLNWLALMGYFTVLLVFSIIAQNNGNSAVWTSSVKHTDFDVPASIPPPTSEMSAQPTYTGTTAVTQTPAHIPQQQPGTGYAGKPVQPVMPQQPSYPQV